MLKLIFIFVFRYKNGKGCTSIYVLALGIIVPLMILGVILILIIKRIWLARRRREEFSWEQFVTNDSLRENTINYPLDSEKKDVGCIISLLIYYDRLYYTLVIESF